MTKVWRLKKGSGKVKVNLERCFVVALLFGCLGLASVSASVRHSHMQRALSFGFIVPRRSKRFPNDPQVRTLCLALFGCSFPGWAHLHAVAPSMRIHLVRKGKLLVG